MARGLMDRYDLFVFDWDGTLSSMKALLRAKEFLKFKVWIRALSLLGMKPAPPKRWPKGAKAANLLELKEHELKNNFLSMWMDLFLLVNRTRLHNGAITTLKALSRNNKKVAIFTNAAGYRIMKEVRASRLDGYLDMVVSTRDIRAFKPDPSGLNTIIKELGVKKGRVLYLGDMVDDVLSARYAGIDSCAIADGFDDYKTLEASSPTYLVKSIRELYSAL